MAEDQKLKIRVQFCCMASLSGVLLWVTYCHGNLDGSGADDR